MPKSEADILVPGVDINTLPPAWPGVVIFLSVCYFAAQALRWVMS